MGIFFLDSASTHSRDCYESENRFSEETDLLFSRRAREMGGSKLKHCLILLIPIILLCSVEAKSEGSLAHLLYKGINHTVIRLEYITKKQNIGSNKIEVIQNPLGSGWLFCRVEK